MIRFYGFSHTSLWHNSGVDTKVKVHLNKLAVFELGVIEESYEHHGKR